MKKLLFLPLLFTSSFAVKDFLIKPNYINSKVLFKTTAKYPQSLDNNSTYDDKNIFFKKGHFRVIVGVDYNNSTITKNLANNILNIMQTIWQKEIINLGFKPPRNSDKYYIDIYIANKDAYNPQKGYVTIPTNYCGYATAYNDKTPYFVINPDISLKILKVTLAHEFFHTIQYAYGFDEVNNTIWSKNIWFLEASAVMMEDEVFDDINDYVNYLPYYINNTYYPIEYANGGIEYGKVLFAKFIKEKYGIEKIKKIFEDYEKNETILDDLKKEFNFNKLMLNYAKCLVNKDNCFKEGKSYPKVKKFTQTDNKNIYYYGILFVDKGIKNYLNSINNQYLQEDFNGSLNRIIDINKSGLIIINSQKDILNENLTLNNKFNFQIKKGWNLVSNVFANEVNLSNFDGLIWVYRDEEYKAYSNINTYKQAIKNSNLEIEKKEIFPKEGFWIYSNKDYNLSFDYLNLSDNNLSLKKGWQIVGFSSAFKPEFINAKIIWQYDKTWRVYSKSYDINYSKIDTISPFKGYFIKK